MKPEKGAFVLSAASLLLLALALLTGGVVFYASFLAVAAVLLADGGRYLAIRLDLKHRLSVTRELSRSEILLGSPLTVTYSFNYRGRKTVPLYCVQPGGRHLRAIAPDAMINLRPGQWSLAYEMTPSGRGSHPIPGLEISFGTRLFRGSMTACGDDGAAINAYPVIDARPGRVHRASPAIGNETTRQGSGSDFSHIRAYVPGDSTRNIDWARSARHGTMVVKTFEDVRPLPVYLLLDVDASMEAGPEKTGLESSVELATLLSGRVLLENERIGVICFSGSDVTAHLPMASGQRQMTMARQLLAAVTAVPGSTGPRGNTALLSDVIAVQNAFGKETGNEGLSAVVADAVRQFSANVKEDGFIKAISRASRASGVPCHIIVATNLSMGMSSLLDGARIARYYGHKVTVALAPRVWFEPVDGIDPEQYYRKYRETMDCIASLRSHRIDVIELSPEGRPEDALAAGGQSRRATGRAR